MAHNPWGFIAEYAEPACAAWRADRLSKHLAAHAIAQIDILAAVVANHLLLGERRSLRGGEESKFRDELGRRIPVLNVVRDAHDAHKHGRLHLAARNFSDGFDPEPRKRPPIFPPFILNSRSQSKPVLVLTLADKTKRGIEGILVEAMACWHAELGHLKIPNSFLKA